MRIPSTQALRALESFATTRQRLARRRRVASHPQRSQPSVALARARSRLRTSAAGRQGRRADAARPPICQRCAQGADRASTMPATQYGSTGVGGSFGVSCTAGLRLAVALHPHRRVSGEISGRVAAHHDAAQARRRHQCRRRRLHRLRRSAIGRTMPSSCCARSSSRRFAARACSTSWAACPEPQDVLRAKLLHLGDFEDWSRWFAAGQRRESRPGRRHRLLRHEPRLFCGHRRAGHRHGRRTHQPQGAGRRPAGAALRYQPSSRRAPISSSPICQGRPSRRRWHSAEWLKSRLVADPQCLKAYAMSSFQVNEISFTYRENIIRLSAPANPAYDFDGTGDRGHRCRKASAWDASRGNQGVSGLARAFGRVSCAERSLARHRPRRVPDASRTLRLWQDHLPDDPRRLHAAERRPADQRRRRHHRRPAEAALLRHGVPGLCALSAYERRGRTSPSR